MNEITLNNSRLPVLCACDILIASEPFYHADRTADFNVLIYVTDGVIYVTEDGVPLEARGGDLMFLKSGVHHYGEREIPRGTRWVFFHFICGDAQPAPAFSPDRGQIPQNDPLLYELTVPKLLRGLKGSPTEKKIFDTVERFRSEDEMKKWYLNKSLFELLTDTALYGSGTVGPRTASDRICDILSELKNEPFRAEDIEKRTFLSYKRLAAVFKKEKGITMQQYHTKLKMESACELLRSTILPVSEISEKTGFSDMFYFSRRFKEYTGVSPSEYRRAAQKIY